MKKILAVVGPPFSLFAQTVRCRLSGPGIDADKTRLHVGAYGLESVALGFSPLRARDPLRHGGSRAPAGSAQAYQAPRAVWQAVLFGLDQVLARIGPKSGCLADTCACSGLAACRN